MYFIQFNEIIYVVGNDNGVRRTTLLLYIKLSLLRLQQMKALIVLTI